jgi:hypothetical protein
MEKIDFAGALHDPVAASIFCHPSYVDHNYVHGKAVISHGRLTRLDAEKLVKTHNTAARELINRASI